MQMVENGDGHKLRGAGVGVKGLDDLAGQTDIDALFSRRMLASFKENSRHRDRLLAHSPAIVVSRCADHGIAG